MALVPAIVSLNWVSNYIGPHRICYKISTDPTYTCTVPGTPGLGFHANCAGNGTPCSYDIEIMVDNETCDPIAYDIYVQPACEDESSLSGRLVLSPQMVFTPSPECKRYNVTCASVSVDSGTVTAAGSGYTVGTFPIPVVGGGGAGATADAIISEGGEVTLYIEDNLGAGYNDGSYSEVSMVNITGAGTGLKMNITVAGGAVTVTAITAAGTGYVSGDTVEPDTGIVGVPGTKETITLTANPLGVLTGITITAPGNGYTTEPVLDLTGLAGGVGATADAVLTDCDALTLYDCTGVTGTILPAGSLALGETYEMCGSAVPTVPASYDAVENGNCLCNCIEQDLQNTNPGGTIDYTYIACNGAVVTGSLAGSGTLGNTCMVDGSLITVVNAPAVESIVVVGPCDAV